MNPSCLRLRPGKHVSHLGNADDISGDLSVSIANITSPIALFDNLCGGGKGLSHRLLPEVLLLGFRRHKDRDVFCSILLMTEVSI